MEYSIEYLTQYLGSYGSNLAALLLVSLGVGGALLTVLNNRILRLQGEHRPTAHHYRWILAAALLTGWVASGLDKAKSFSKTKEKVEAKFGHSEPCETSIVLDGKKGCINYEKL